jgi:hypothetical protein
MLVGTEKRKKRNSTKINLVISACFHAVLVGAVLYFAAHEGWLGKQAQYLTAFIEQPKPPEKPKEMPKPKEEVAKVDVPKAPDVPKPPPIVETHTAPPPSSVAPTAVAPPPADAPTFSFGEGADVKSGDAVEVYRDMLRRALELNWDRPTDNDDHTNVAEVEIAVDKQTGKISNAGFKMKSGQKEWDDSVQTAIASTPPVKTRVPTNFPSRVVVRFDVREQDADARQP